MIQVQRTDEDDESYPAVRMVMSVTYQPIESYGIIGDLDTVALVGMDGSIDFMCFPHFDSPSIFAAILDHRRGGRFQIAPVLGGARQKQLYVPDTNVLLTLAIGRPASPNVFSSPGRTQGLSHLDCQ